MGSIEEHGVLDPQHPHNGMKDPEKYLFDNIYIIALFTEKSCSKPLELMFLYTNNNIESRDANDVKINMVWYNLIGGRRCSAVSRKTACKCFTASNLAHI